AVYTARLCKIILTATCTRNAVQLYPIKKPGRKGRVFPQLWRRSYFFCSSGLWAASLLVVLSPPTLLLAGLFPLVAVLPAALPLVAPDRLPGADMVFGAGAPG